MTEPARTVLAVVVTYLPDEAALRALLHALLAQVDQVLIVDNTPASDDRVHAATAGFAELSSTLRLLRLGDNLGIAAALNIDVQIDAGYADSPDGVKLQVKNGAVDGKGHVVYFPLPCSQWYDDLVFT